LLQPVPTGSKNLAEYTHLVGRPLTQEIRDLADRLEGLRVLHLSATAFGGGVSEILYTLVPLMQDVGIEAEWQVIVGREEFFNATKLLHNALQGNPLDLSPEEWTTWEQYNEMNARGLEGGWDVVVVHDPQPAALRRHVPELRPVGASAGLHVLAWLPPGIDEARVVARAREAGVNVDPLGPYWGDGGPGGLLFGYGGIAEAAIDEGVRIIAAALAQSTG
jgi:hypothetical protein